MMKIKHFRIGLLIAVVCVVPLSTTRANPICDCFYYPNHLRAFRDAKMIFIGEVTKVDRKAEGPDELASEVTQAITFRVEKRWKGPNVRKVRAWEHSMHSMCVNWKFEEGEKYLIYASSIKGVLVVDGYCSRTRRLETNNAEAIREFKQLNSPTFLRKARKQPM